MERIKVNRKNIKIAVGTVIYQIEESILHDFVDAINYQIDLDFDLLVLNDNIGQKELEAFINGVHVSMWIRDAAKRSTISRNRIELLFFAKEKEYDLLILIDFDDIMDKKRVFEYRKQFEEDYFFFYNNLETFDGNAVFKKLPCLTHRGDITEHNYLGLSNTGVNLNKISFIFLESLKKDVTDIFDWYFYERLLLCGAVGKYVSNTITRYRIIKNNLAGINIDIEKEINVKKNHYKLLSEYGNIYHELYKSYEHMRYIEKQDGKKGYWWENTIMKEE